jgi:hypothetical protein
MRVLMCVPLCGVIMPMRWVCRCVCPCVGEDTHEMGVLFEMK